jgi:transcriptional regulator with XRE-family HTH domain
MPPHALGVVLQFAHGVLPDPAAADKHYMCESGRYVGRMRESSTDLDDEDSEDSEDSEPEITDAGTGHARGLRRILRQARKDLKLSARQVALRIEIRLRQLGDPDAKAPSVSSIYAWEKFQRHPPVSVYAAWARAVDHQLLMELDALNSRRKPVLLETGEATEIGRELDAMPEQKRRDLAALIRRIAPLPDDKRRALMRSIQASLDLMK